MQFWIGSLSTQTREQVRVQFKNSSEFQARVNAVVNQGCFSPTGSQLRVSVGGFGYVSGGGVSCGVVEQLRAGEREVLVVAGRDRPTQAAPVDQVAERVAARNDLRQPSPDGVEHARAKREARLE